MSEKQLTRRQKKLRQALQENRLEAAALNPGPDLAYLTGLDFHLMERPIVAIFPLDQDPLIILPELEMAQVQAVDFEMTVISYSEERAAWPQAFRTAFEKLGLTAGSIGVIPRRLRLLEFEYLRDAGPEVDFRSAQGIFASLRMVKDASELKKMREAARIAECALQATLSSIKPGVTEKEIASRLVSHLLHQGSDPALPFFPIVSFGSNTANPHAGPTNRELHHGELVLIDWGASKDGYFSDITRTFAMGDVEPELEKLAEFVRRANKAARKAAQTGIPAQQVDLAARETIGTAGYGDFFIHRTGHGLGREAHEEPYISQDDQTRLQPGMTFTLEPGIYLPNRGGVRIEDDVVMTENGLETLTHLPRELTQLLLEE